jgi:hypothetical protein
MGKHKQGQAPVEVVFTARETATGRTQPAVATGRNITQVSGMLSDLSKGGEVEVVDPRRVR